MKNINNTLKTVIGTWEDPGDYPSGAGSGPLPNQQFVEYVDGTVEVELSIYEWEAIYDYADIDITLACTLERRIEAWLKDNADKIDPDVPGLKVQSWCLEAQHGDRITLSVNEFEAGLPEPDYDED